VADPIFDPQTDPYGSGTSSKLMALEALQELASAQVTPALIEALASPSEEVRCWACRWLGKQKDRRIRRVSTR
jgi:hypothetical protein